MNPSRLEMFQIVELLMTVARNVDDQVSVLQPPLHEYEMIILCLHLKGSREAGKQTSRL